MNESIADKYFQYRAETILKYITAINSEYFYFDSKEDLLIVQVVKEQLNWQINYSPPALNKTVIDFVEKYNINDVIQQNIILSLFRLGNTENRKNVLLKMQLIFLGFFLEEATIDYDKRLNQKELKKVLQKLRQKAKEFHQEDLMILIDINQKKILETFKKGVYLRRKIQKKLDEKFFDQREHRLKNIKATETVLAIATKPIYGKMSQANKIKVDELLDEKEKEKIKISAEMAMWKILQNAEVGKDENYLIKIPDHILKLKTVTSKLCQLSNNQTLLSKIILEISESGYLENEATVDQLGKAGFKIASNQFEWLIPLSPDIAAKFDALIIEEMDKAKLRGIDIFKDKKIFSYA